MGVEIQLWRIRIGCFTSCKSAFKSVNESGFYCLNRENIAAFLRLLTLLLILSGDVELNPGPFSILTNLPFSGHLHQGSSLFSPQSAGKQCLPCCIVFFMDIELKNYPKSGSDLDSIIHVGDYIFRDICSKYKPPLLNLRVNNLPSIIKYHGVSFSVKLQKTFSGKAYKGFVGSYPLISIERALCMGLSSEKYAIFACKGNTSAVYKHGNEYVVFESQSRSKHGLCIDSGTCVLLKIKTIDDLSNYFRRVLQSNCLKTDLDHLYDFHVFTFCRVTEERLKNYSEAVICNVPIQHEQKVDDNVHENPQSLCTQQQKDILSTSVFANLPLQGNFHQGCSVFSVESIGRQCLTCCIAFFLKIEKSHTIQSSFDVDSILYVGDYIYRFVLSSKSLCSSYLHPSDLPDIIKDHENAFMLKLKKTFSGGIGESFIVNGPFLTLENAITYFVAYGHYAVFVCKGNALAIYKQGNEFIVFDSHSRDINGLCSSDGSSVVTKWHGLNALCSFVRKLVISLGRKSEQSNCQYDLHVLSLSVLKTYHICKHTLYANKSVCVLPTSESDTILRASPFCSKNSVKDKQYSNRDTVKGKRAPVPANPSSTSTMQEQIVLTDLPFLTQTSSAPRSKKRKCNDLTSKPANLGSCKKRKVIDSDPDKGIQNNSDLADHFHSLIQYGPEYICTSCSQLLFKHAVKQYKYSVPLSCFEKKCVTGTKSVNNLEWICLSCSEYLKKRVVPPCSKGNNLKFAEIPDDLADLTDLEERLTAPRIPFMQIRELPRGGQHGIKGNVVNVPSDVNKTIRLLPRGLNDCETVPLKLKRSLSVNSYILFQQIRPQKVVTAVKWLLRNSLIFQNEGIQLDENWIYQFTRDLTSIGNNSNSSQVSSCPVEMDSETDDWTEPDEIDARQPFGNLDTCMQPADFREFNRIINVAPAEGNNPLGMFQDVNAEFLAFPKIYCGQARDDNNERKTPLHYSTICKWELRNKDRRVACNISNIFFKLKKVQIKQVADKVSLAIRKCKLKDGKLTVADVLDSNNIANLVKHDEGYKVLRTLRGSPPYWEQAKKDIFAMIRQLGIPTWFCSFSAAETKWSSLLRILGNVVKNVHYNDQDILNLTWQEKCELIKSDPVTCARYFDHRVQLFLSKVLQSNLSPIGKIQDFFYRVEFQQRGSPHIHMLVWIEQAPLLSSHSHSDIVSFIDKYVCCEKDEHMRDLVNYQTHRHARTCRKKGKSVCRFGFPLPPMKETMILAALDINSNERKKAESNYCIIMDELEKMKLAESDASFESFLSKLKLTYEEYVLAIRSSIPASKSKLFLKRSFAEIRVNSYNKTLLKCWEANMDIQYILDPFSCAAYIVSYISKGQRGMSNLLNEACKAARESASDIKQQVRHIGNVFLTNVEIGAQEAVYLLLQMPLRRSSRSVVFVNTNPPDDRVALIKPYNKLKEMSKNSTSIEADNSIKRYQRRPNTMSEYCLADYVAWFDVHYPNKGDTNRESLKDCNNELQEDDYKEDTVDDPLLENNKDRDGYLNIPLNEHTDKHKEEHYARDGSVLQKRRTCKVLYCVGYSIENDRENHFRELLMLYLPWRNENHLIGEFASYEERYTHFKDIVEKNRHFYNSMSSSVITELGDELFNFTHGESDTVVPETQHQNELDAMEGCKQSETYMSFDPGPPCNSNTYDLALDIGSGRKQLSQDEQIQGDMPDGEYRSLVQSLNKKQKEFFYHVLLWQKTKTEPLYNFLSGGAGVGKSVLLKALYQALNKYYSHRIGANPDDINVLVCAPTGKAAYNVGGVTIHSAFNIPADQGFNFKPLDMQQLGTFQAKFQHLKIIFIDEVSMVGQRMFNFINLRLQEIMATTKPFGGLSLIAFGDLYQLKPVMDKWIFSSSSSFQNSEDLATSLWEQYFAMFELDQIMRQQGDKIFAELLNRLREGCHQPGDIHLLKQQVVVNNESFPEIPHLFTKRAEVDEHNKVIFDSSCEKKAFIYAIDTVSGNFPNVTKATILSKVPNDCSKTKGISKVLDVAENLPAELCSNVDVSDGMANGTPCLIKKLDYRVENSDRCSIIWVQFEEEIIGKKHRNRYKHLRLSTIPPSWTPIIEITVKFSFNYYKSFHITRRQFPLHLSSAKTVHKAQGSTMAEAVIHFGSRKIDHMHYVGLSRVRNLASVKILNLNENNICQSSAVVGEMKRLREISVVELAIPLVYSFPSDSFTIIYHNCRSLNKHILDLQNDMNFLAANVIALSETRLHTDFPSANFDLPGFKLFRNDSCLNSTNNLAYHGSAIYTKNFNSISEVHNSCNIEITTTHIFTNDFRIRIIIIYCPPGKATISNMKDLFSKLDSTFNLANPTIILGDFNIDLSTDHNLPQFLDKHFQLQQLISTPTTDYGSILDHIYTNVDTDRIFQSGTLEAYHSDHKPIYITLK